MDAWQQLLASYPLLQTIWDAAIVIFPLATLLAYCGIQFLSATAKILSVSKRRSSYNKCSRQIALLALILGWGLLVGSRIWLYFTQAQHVPGTLANFLLEMSWLLLSLGVLFSSIYYCLWRILKNMPVLHSTLGMICAVQNCIALVCILFVLRLQAAAIPGGADRLALPELFPEAWDAPLWSAASYACPLIIALAAAISSCWLVLRRKKDDFGRDYYNTMLAWCSAWARNAWALLWLLMVMSESLKIWLQTREGIFNLNQGILDSSILLLWFVPVLLWTWVMRSRLPLRESWALFVNFVLAGLFTLPWYLELVAV